MRCQLRERGATQTLCEMLWIQLLLQQQHVSMYKGGRGADGALKGQECLFYYQGRVNEQRRCGRSRGFVRGLRR
ncbi:Hypothetical protein SMAX5B_014835 [Scophthalmus maximus]|uniref:Uncharacterized protein n=1 Tax=Scophthalmus maximus TaxID=52904 RepID=A0A2U9C066_SCOMX|nr:Hypothetical protein SMAX5B_014835 [Scophthalmus maximus]